MYRTPIHCTGEMSPLRPCHILTWQQWGHAFYAIRGLAQLVMQKGITLVRTKYSNLLEPNLFDQHFSSVFFITVIRSGST